jgi:hypothetical protein
MDRHLPRQDLALNLSAKRRLCNTVGGRVIEGAPRCCAVSTAPSRAAAMTNLARSNHSLVLCALFGEAKSCVLVNIFMICPRWSAGLADDNQILPLIAAISWHVTEHGSTEARRVESSAPGSRRRA